MFIQTRFYTDDAGDGGGSADGEPKESSRCGNARRGGLLCETTAKTGGAVEAKRKRTRIDDVRRTHARTHSATTAVGECVECGALRARAPRRNALLSSRKCALRRQLAASLRPAPTPPSIPFALVFGMLCEIKHSAAALAELLVYYEKRTRKWLANAPFVRRLQRAK